MFGLKIIRSRELKRLKDIDAGFLQILEKKNEVIVALTKELNNSQQYGICKQMHTDRKERCGSHPGQTSE